MNIEQGLPRGALSKWCLKLNKTRIRAFCEAPQAMDIYNTLSKGGRRETLDKATVSNWCEHCLTGSSSRAGDAGLHINIDSGGRMAADNLSSMTVGDFVTLGFCAFVLAMKVSGEIKDIELCRVGLERAKAAGGIRTAERRLLLAICFARQWVFIPLLLQTVLLLVVFMKNDALSICFNFVALLFLCDVDNLAFHFALGERLRSQVVQLGHVRLSDVEMKRISWTTSIHMVVVWGTIIVVVAAITGNDDYVGLTVLLPELCPFVALALAGVAVAVAHARCALSMVLSRTIAAKICEAFGKCILSFALCTVFLTGRIWIMFASTGTITTLRIKAREAVKSKIV
jgi:hypothetical protein